MWDTSVAGLDIFRDQRLSCGYPSRHVLVCDLFLIVVSMKVGGGGVVDAQYL